MTMGGTGGDMGSKGGYWADMGVTGVTWGYRV